MSEKDKTLSLYSGFDQIGGQFKKSKELYLKQEEKAHKLIEAKTKNEKVILEAALKEYNEKIKSVVESKEYKKIENKALQHSSDVSKNLKKAFTEFNKVKEQIMKRDDISDRKKQQKITKLIDYIFKKLYTEEEIARFKGLLNNVVVINPSNQIENIVDSATSED